MNKIIKAYGRGHFVIPPIMLDAWAKLTVAGFETGKIHALLRPTNFPIETSLNQMVKEELKQKAGR